MPSPRTTPLSILPRCSWQSRHTRLRASALVELSSIPSTREVKPLSPRRCPSRDRDASGDAASPCQRSASRTCSVRTCIRCAGTASRPPTRGCCRRRSARVSTSMRTSSTRLRVPAGQRGGRARGRGGRNPLSQEAWRYRWPDEIRDEVLARLLALNAERAPASASPASRPGRGPRGRFGGRLQPCRGRVVSPWRRLHDAAAARSVTRSARVVPATRDKSPSRGPAGPPRG